MARRDNTLATDVEIIKEIPQAEMDARAACRRARNAGRLRGVFGIATGLSGIFASQTDAATLTGKIAIGMTAVSFTGLFYAIVVENNRNSAFEDALANRSREDLFGSRP